SNTNNQLVDGSATLNNAATLSGTGPVDQSVTQSANNDITQAGGAANAVSSNTADPTVVIDNTQTGSATTNPVATATAGAVTTRNLLTQDGDNNLSIFDSADLTGGDGVAGSQVIGTAGSGAASI